MFYVPAENFTILLLLNKVQTQNDRRESNEDDGEIRYHAAEQNKRRPFLLHGFSELKLNKTLVGRIE